MKKVFLILIFLIINVSLIAANRTASVSDNWNSTVTWGGDPVPVAGDDVTIAGGITVTINISNAVCASLSVGNNTNSTALIDFDPGSHLTVSGTVTLGSNGNSNRKGSIIMERGGILSCSGFSIVNLGNWVPGVGTVELTANNTLPPEISSFYNLTISDGLTTINSDIVVTGDWNYTSTTNGIGGTGAVSLAGNFSNSNSTFNDEDISFTFNGTSDQTISSASGAPSLSTFGTVYFDNPGTVTLLTDIEVGLFMSGGSSVHYVQGTIAFSGGSTLYDNGVEYSGPTPVELVSFSAKISNNKVILYWNTATEVNNYGFEIQRSAKTDKWEVVGFVEGHGNSNSPKIYNFTDSKVNSAGTYSYRLKQIDNDGSYEFSKTIEVKLGTPVTLVLKQNYPNPFNPSTTISFTLPESGNVSLKIFNTLGEEVATFINGYTEAGIYSYNFNAENMPSGIYSLTKKMLFLK